MLEVVLYCGDMHTAPQIQFFFSKNKELLSKEGIEYVYLPYLHTTARRKREEIGEYLENPNFIKPMRNIIKAVQKKEAQGLKKVVFFLPHLMQNLFLLDAAVKLVEKEFPQNTCKGLAFYTSSEKSIEAHLHFFCLYSYPIPINNFLHNVENRHLSLPAVKAYIRSIFPQKNLLEKEGDLSPEEIIETLLNALQVAPELRNEFDLRDLDPLIIPRDILKYMEKANNFLPHNGHALEDSHWVHEHKLFAAGKDFRSFLSPEQREHVKKRDEAGIAVQAGSTQESKEQEENKTQAIKKGQREGSEQRASNEQPIEEETKHSEQELWTPVQEVELWDMDQYLPLLTPSMQEKMREAVKLLNFSVSAPTPKISVLSFSYNHAKYIEQCITSVLQQKITVPYEHIIFDDGSKDGSQEIILRYAQQYPQIKAILKKENTYNDCNTRVALTAIRGDYVALCEGDDYFTDENKLQKQLDFLEANPKCGLCFHNVQVVYEDSEKESHIFPTPDFLPRGVRPFYYLSDAISYNFIQTNSVMYRWRFKNGFPPWFRFDLFPSDWYWHLLHIETGPAGYLAECMSAYRRHESSTYYLAAVDPMTLRYKWGRKELELYEHINTHFGGNFSHKLCTLANSLFITYAYYILRTKMPKDQSQGPNAEEESKLTGNQDTTPNDENEFSNDLDAEIEFNDLLLDFPEFAEFFVKNNAKNKENQAILAKKNN